MSKIKREKIYIDIAKPKKLIRQRDSLAHEGEIEFIEFDEEGRGLATHNIPQVGYSCIVGRSKFGHYKWLTTPITELISNTEFKTNNSHYKIEE